MNKREIKFRAWIPEDWYEDEPQEWFMTYDLAFEDYEPINDLLASVDHLMQFTGRKDGAGNNIYEGDIVELALKNDATGDVTLKLYRVGWCSEWDRWNLYDEANREAHLGFVNLHESLVVGNIYENPELMRQIA